ncbi:uncharacterized protein LOC130965904 [Arachis stenosperma]|uniref:uncharacterized protein LOC130965904 n=1 Tax=Arachis stenosperma TaxID=217475 RepID=UPI0025ACDF01|nr:uncharacterized protein LOC130965904 [Arachis stenosperma]
MNCGLNDRIGENGGIIPLAQSVIVFGDGGFVPPMKVDATGRRGLSPLQKYTAAIQMLAYGVAADAVDDYVRIGESTTIECLKKFVEGVISVFKDEYFRKSNPNDVQCLLQIAKGRGFSDMLDRSPAFDDILNDRVSEVNYTINCDNYTIGYYLADGIYSEWATFVKSFSKPQEGETQVICTIPRKAKKRCGASIRSIASTLCNYMWSSSLLEKKKLANIMRACIILHNMIFKDERDTYAENFAQDLEYDDVENNLSQPQLEEEDFAPYH